ncbi:MAG: MMPL family transporter [Planctomycetota bacterium]|nr:MMPL family transporter [Planctomycetota bacterium]
MATSPEKTPDIEAPRVAALIDRLIRWRLPLLVIGILLAVLAYAPSRQVRFDQSIENMFAVDDPLLVPYRQMNRTFGGNEVVLAAYIDPQVLSVTGMERLTAVTERLSKVSGVRAVQSLSNTPLGNSIANPNNPLSGKLLSLFEGYAIGTDRQTVAIVCLLKRQGETVPSTETVDQLRTIIQEQPSGMLAGEPVMIVDGFRYLEADGRLLMTISTALLILTILLCFRSFRWVLIPLAVVQLTLWLTLASLSWLDLKLTLVSSMLSAIVTIVGIATVMHLVVRFRDERARGNTPKQSLRIAGIVLAGPIVSACVTDTVGCGSLLLARVGPVQDFGAMTAIGLTLILLSSILLVPGLALLGRWDTDPKRSWGEDRLDLGLYRAIDSVERHPWLYGGVALLLAVLALIGTTRLDIESDFTKNFRAGSPLVRSYEMVETRLGGAGVWELIIPAPQQLNAEFLLRVSQLESRLRSEATVENAEGQQVSGLTKVFSLADVVQAVSPLSLETLSQMPAGVSTSALNVLGDWMPQTISAMHANDPENPTQYYFRIMLRSNERQSAAQKKQLIATVERIGLETFGPVQLPDGTVQSGAKVTGFFVLLTHLIDSLLRDQWLTFLVATAGMWLVMLVVFRSMVLATIGLVPNVLPVFMMTGLMGWLGLQLNMGAAVIAAFSMGLSVDSTVHYIVDFRRARQAGGSMRAALDAAQQSAGRAAVFATLALVVGFSALCFSEFVPTIYFGALTSLTMLGGLAGNLLLLPLLLRLLSREG